MRNSGLCRGVGTTYGINPWQVPIGKMERLGFSRAVGHNAALRGMVQDGGMSDLVRSSKTPSCPGIDAGFHMHDPRHYILSEER